MLGCGNNTRTRLEVYHPLNNKYPERLVILQSTLGKSQSKFYDHGHVRDLPKSRRPKIDGERQ